VRYIFTTVFCLLWLKLDFRRRAAEQAVHVREPEFLGSLRENGQLRDNACRVRTMAGAGNDFVSMKRSIWSRQSSICMTFRRTLPTGAKCYLPRCQLVLNG
jgi:hypothetical protein